MWRILHAAFETAVARQVTKAQPRYRVAVESCSLSRRCQRGGSTHGGQASVKEVLVLVSRSHRLQERLAGVYGGLCARSPWLLPHSAALVEHARKKPFAVPATGRAQYSSPERILNRPNFSASTPIALTGSLVSGEKRSMIWYCPFFTPSTIHCDPSRLTMPSFVTGRVGRFQKSAAFKAVRNDSVLVFVSQETPYRMILPGSYPPLPEVSLTCIHPDPLDRTTNRAAMG